MQNPIAKNESTEEETSASSALEKDVIIKSLKEQLAALEKKNADLITKNLVLQDSKSDDIPN